MSLGRVLRVLLAAALLSAQHAALAHQIWHSVDQKSQPAQKQLCGQHDALGTVAGAVDGGTVAASAELPSAFAFRSVTLPEAKAPGLAPSSRGPPTLL
jgi:hypothetical protein